MRAALLRFLRRRSFDRFSLAISCCLVAISGSSVATAAPKLRGTIAYATFTSRALKGTAHYSIYLPADYGSSATRYPVIYYLHGLPASATSYKSIERIAAAVEASGHPAIVIGVQGARTGDSDPEWRDWAAGRNWETATTKELVAVVDQRYRTMATRAGRLLVGISAGGYGATLLAFHHPGIYSVVESWSGYFHATTPDGTAALDLGSAEADDLGNAHKQIVSAKHFLSGYNTPTYFAFYTGTDDARFKDENVEFYRELRKAGLSRVVFKLYPGGHNWLLWQSHATSWIGKALAIAAKPQ